MNNEYIKGIFVPSRVMRIADTQKVSMVIRLNEFSDLQLKRMSKMVESGFIKGNSLNALVARGIRLKAKLPIVTIGEYARLGWQNMPPTDEAFDVLARYGAMAKIVVSDESSNEAWKIEYIRAMNRAVSEKRKNSKVGSNMNNDFNYVQWGFFVIKKVSSVLEEIDLGVTPALREHMMNIRCRKVSKETIYFSD